MTPFNPNAKRDEATRRSEYVKMRRAFREAERIYGDKERGGRTFAEILVEETRREFGEDETV